MCGHDVHQMQHGAGEQDHRAACSSAFRTALRADHRRGAAAPDGGRWPSIHQVVQPFVHPIGGGMRRPWLA